MTISTKPGISPPDSEPPESPPSVPSPPGSPTPASRALHWVPGHRRITLGAAAGVVAVIVVLSLVINSGGSTTPQKVTTPTTALSTNPIVASYDKQLPSLAAAVAKSPNSASALTAYGVALYATGNLNGALTQYTAELKLNPKDPVLLNNIGNVYRDLGMYPKALSSYQNSISVAPTSATAYINLANLYDYTLRQPALAITTIKDAKTNIPKDADLGVLLGLAYEQTNNKPAAKTAYQAVLKLDPGNAAATAGLKRVTGSA